MERNVSRHELMFGYHGSMMAMMMAGGSLRVRN
jgi:hypothetical protein